MFAIMPLPVFTGDNSSMYRPAVPSPLSSSPIRASSPPLGPRDPNILPRREIQSSPIPAPKFKFASRPARPNPVVQKREAAQESRRKLFLNNVRQRADDKRWERRGGENELLKLEWFSMSRDLTQAKSADLEGVVSEAEIEDATQLQEQLQEQLPQEERPAEMDDMMVDVLEHEAQAELDALISSIPAEPSSSDRIMRPDSPQWSDDEDYDALFMDFISQEDTQGIVSSGQMDMS